MATKRMPQSMAPRNAGAMLAEEYTEKTPSPMPPNIPSGEIYMDDPRMLTATSAAQHGKLVRISAPRPVLASRTRTMMGITNSMMMNGRKVFALLRTHPRPN